jgi:hypothetical protein
MAKGIKKILRLTLIFTFIFSCSACDYEYYLYHENIRKETRVSFIELINYNNPDAQNNPLEKYPFNVEYIEILEALSTDSVDGFLIELSEIGRLSSKGKNILNSPNGIGIRLTYHDNGFTLITVTVVNGEDSIFVGHYDASANIEGYYGISLQEMIDDFRVFVNEYFITQIS